MTTKATWTRDCKQRAHASQIWACFFLCKLSLCKYLSIRKSIIQVWNPSIPKRTAVSVHYMAARPKTPWSYLKRCTASPIVKVHNLLLYLEEAFQCHNQLPLLKRQVVPIISSKYINWPPTDMVDKLIFDFKMPAKHLLLLLWVATNYLNGHFLALLCIINWLVVILNGCNSTNINKLLLRYTNWSSNGTASKWFYIWSNWSCSAAEMSKPRPNTHHILAMPSRTSTPKTMGSFLLKTQFGIILRIHGKTASSEASFFFSSLRLSM